METEPIPNKSLPNEPINQNVLASPYESIEKISIFF